MKVSGLGRVRTGILAGMSGIFLACLLVFSAGSQAQEVAPPGFVAEEGIPPAGANIACEPSEEHPFPVILVHGTFENMAQNWSVLSPRLAEEGYCVFALNYGSEGDGNDAAGGGLGPIQTSARDLDRFVDDVLDYTGAEKVQLVGHSQGGMMPRYWIKNLGGASEVEDLVGLAPSNYGTELNDNGAEFPGEINPCRACDQQNASSGFIRNLNEGDDTPGDGSFTQIAVRNDEIIIPFTNSFLKGKRLTENLIVQDYNGGVPVTHQNVYNDPAAQEITLDALDNPGPADPERATGEEGPEPQPDDGCTIRGTNGNDSLRGTSGRDVICGLGGNDVIRGLGGNDVLRGGDGSDVIYGGNGNDRIEGGNGNDALYGEQDDDTLLGGAGDDRLSGGPGNDRTDGGPGRNSVEQ